MERVRVTDEIRLMEAYDEPAAENMPMFAENRVHQRSSGNPYPNKVVMRVDREHRGEMPFRVITLENEYLRVELMPQLGGRIYSAMDKRTGYDFFYKQHVIKPALIGMLGSWISGGCEFNWPCHHRPSTFMPVDVAIEREENGAVTVWMSENEPLNRMKGMVGVYLAPGEARFDTRMKVYNRTPARHSFLWWENAAVPVNEHYRLVFPPDVHYVQFHYRKNVTSYPVASGVYNGIRMGDGVDISYHKNTRQPTSYFCAQTAYDFFGGYDEGKRAGVIHVADRTVSVGKKMFTWAYNQLSRSWEHALTDADGPYAELMASSYSLNQPDFTWLMPYECKEFSQMWYPVGAIGTPLCACREAAIAIEDGVLRLQAAVPLTDARLMINHHDVIFSADPDTPFEMALEEELSTCTLVTANGRKLLCYDKPDPEAICQMPATIPDNPTLNQLTTAQELYLTGVHAAQYRDPAARPDAYWREALKRDPEYVPALTALAGDELECFRVVEAQRLAVRAWNKATTRNFHPESGELPYLLGRITEARGNEQAAWNWYMQAAWSQDARSRALTRAAMIEGRRRDWDAMNALAEKALLEHQRNETAMALRVIALRHTDAAAAERALEELEAFDPLSPVMRALKLGAVPALYKGMESDACQTVLDIVTELVEAGETGLSAALLEALPVKCAQTEYVRYYLTGDETALMNAAKLDVGIAYPIRALEYRALNAAVVQCPWDANALNLLACLLYHTRNFREAEALWSKAAEIDTENAALYRNLAVARYSHLSRRDEALTLLDKALSLNPHDEQLVWEKALVMARTRQAPERIIDFLKKENSRRDDIQIELCQAYNMAGQYEKTLRLMEKISFTPCEGGEHAVADQYMFAHHALGRAYLAKGSVHTALKHFQAAQKLPDHLGAGLWNEVRLVPHQFYEAVCLQKLGKEDEARALLDHILLLKQDYFSNMNLPELPCWQAMAHRQLGREAPARELIAAHIRAQEAGTQAVDAGYYRTTPFFISYMEDPAAQRRAGCIWQAAMAAFAAGDTATASVHAKSSLELDPLNLYAHLMI